MGDVYRASDPRLQRDVAIKLIRKHLRWTRRVRRFEQEARAAGQLNHPNIWLSTTSAFTAERAVHRFELLEGESLARVCKAGRCSPGRP